MSDPVDTAKFLTASDPLLGQTVQGRYRIEKRLGQGGMGAVYLAEHVLIQKKVAIKCLHAGLANNPDLIRRFHNEAVAATAIGNPHIVDVTDMGRFDDGSYFMVLEFLEGRDFQKVLDEEGAQPLDRVAHIAVQLCDALEAARQKGIVHRDLKPENIFLIKRHGDSDFVKVLDFGISKFKTDVSGSTRTGELMGTPYYMSPEQVRGERDLTFKSDIYTTGVILFQALANTVPFEADTLPALILKIAHEPAPLLSQYLPNVPSVVVQLINRMLDKHPEVRPRDFFEVSQTLAPYAREGGTRSSHLAASLAGTLHGVPNAPNVSIIPKPVAAESAPAQGTPAQGAPVPPGLNVAPTQISAGTVEPVVSALGAKAVESAPKETKGGKAGLGIALGVGALAVAAGLFIARKPSEKMEDLETPATTAPPNAAAVRVQISTLPPDCDLTLNGEPITNPFDGELPKSKDKGILRVSRDGFMPQERALVLTSDQRIFVQLNPDAPAPLSSAQAIAVAPTSGGKKSPPKPSPGPVTDPAPTPPPTPAVEKPAPAPAPAPATEPAKPSGLKKVF